MLGYNLFYKMAKEQVFCTKIQCICAVSQSQMPKFPDDKIQFLSMYNYSNSLSYTLLFYWPNSYLGSSLATLSPLQ